MNVILVKEVPSLGNPGELVKVKNGYARNYLIPNKLALRESEESLKILEKQKDEFAKVVEAKKLEYKALADKLAAITELNLKVKTGEDEKIFGTITTAHLVASLKEQFGIDIDKKLVVLKDHIKSLGTYVARVQLSKEFKTDLSFNVVADA
jgi:large subunit ribosomal protein L9